jgi:hypothetical protein
MAGGASRSMSTNAGVYGDEIVCENGHGLFQGELISTWSMSLDTDSISSRFNSWMFSYES